MEVVPDGGNSRFGVWTGVKGGNTMCCIHMNRRQFLGVSTGTLAGAAMFGPMTGLASAAPVWADDYWDPARPYQRWTRPTRVQPVLMYRVPQRREQTSWKSWGGVQSHEAANEEANRIAGELGEIAKRADFPLEILPVIKVTSEEDTAKAQSTDAEVTILYPATGSGNMLRGCVRPDRTIVFVRHRSGPSYYWYEALSTRYLKPNTIEEDPENRPLSVEDVVVDEPDELLWRLRALHAVDSFRGARIVALGGPMGKYAAEAPDVARERYGLDIVDFTYEELERRIQDVMADSTRMAQSEKWADTFLAMPGTTLQTDRGFVVRAFMLYGLFKDIMRENDASLFTIQQCMSTIMPMSQTTACLTLGLLNDEGLVAFCESDFVVIPAGILLNCIAGKPIFMHNSTFPHKGIVTCAHCASPRRMNGDRYEPMLVTTHYESEYGAAPKVEFPVGQEVTFIDPEYASNRWLCMTGTVEDNPFLEICRSQQDVRIHGDWKKLINEVRDSHWMMCYGDYRKEVAYAAPRVGITLDTLAEV